MSVEHTGARVQPAPARCLVMAAGPISSSTLPVEGSLRPELIDPIADPRWLELLEHSPAAGPFHHPLWLELLRGQYGYPIALVGLVETDGELVAGLPVARVSSRLTGTRLVALPFSDVCPPAVVEGASGDVAAQLARAIDAYRRREGLELEVRASLPGQISASAGPSFLHHTIALEPDVAKVEARFSKSRIRRGAISKPRREGVKIAFCRDRSALDDFFHLHVRARRHQGVPTQPKRFIRRFERLFDHGLGWVALARWNDATIAAAVFLSFHGTVVYKYAASDRRHLDKRPNNLLFMEAIRRACGEGAHTLDLGRTDPHNKGLAAFKAAWGATEHELSYLRLGGARATDGGGVPAPVQKLIQRGPPIVGRLIGAALYRHFG